MRAARYAVALLCALTSPAYAQVSYPPAPPIDTSGFATTSALSAVQATIPTPAATVPPMETPPGAVGTAGTYRPGDSVQPRITRAGSCTVSGGAGVCTGTWSTAFPSGAAINVIFTPINPAATLPIECNLTATPTTTTYAAKCWILQTTTLSLAIVTAGLNLAPAAVAPNGTVIQVTGLPVTQ